MLTRREVEGELRSLGFRASARERRAEREKMRRFAQGLLGVAFGVSLLALLGAVNVLRTTRSDLASGHSRSRAVATEWVSGNTQPSRRAASLFFTGRRTRHPDDPRGRGRHRSDD
jgi:hypothetical protein